MTDTKYNSVQSKKFKLLDAKTNRIMITDENGDLKETDITLSQLTNAIANIADNTEFIKNSFQIKKSISPTAILDIDTNHGKTFTIAGNLIKVDWGDGTTDSTNNHTYSEVGTYTIKILEKISDGFRLKDNTSLISVNYLDTSNCTSFGYMFFWMCIINYYTIIRYF